MVAVVGTLIAIIAGLVFAVVIVVRRGPQASTTRSLASAHHAFAFQHTDAIRTSFFEWLFMAGAAVVVLIGFPVILAVIFQFLVPMLGRAWSR